MILHYIYGIMYMYNYIVVELKASYKIRKGKAMKKILAVSAVLLSVTCLMTSCRGGSDLRYYDNGDMTYTVFHNHEDPCNTNNCVKICESEECVNLKIPMTESFGIVTEVKFLAFSGMSNIESVELPITVTKIGDKAFADCTNLASVELPKYLEHIGNNAFSGCKSLTSIVIPENTQFIGNAAFKGCASLTEIHIPASVTKIGDDAFLGCTSLTKITVDENNASYTSIDGNLYTKDGKLLIKYAPANTAETFKVPESVTVLKENAFADCVNLKLVTIEPILPDGLATKDEKVDKKVPAFEIEVAKQITELKYNLVDGNCYLGNKTNAYVVFVKATDKQASSYSIHSDTVYIHDAAFKDCEGVASISLPEKIKAIGNQAFSGCSNLSSVIPLSNTLKVIGSKAFEKCTSLTTFTVDKNVEQIGEAAFSGCDGLAEIYLSYVGGMKNFDQADAKQREFAYIFGSVPSSLKTVVITGGTNIAPDAFKGCSGIERLELPKTLQSVGLGAFKGCTGLKSIVLPFVGAEKAGGANTHLGYAFGAADYKKNAASIPSGLTVIELCGAVNVGDYAFYGTSIKEIVIDDSLKYIGANAFLGCEKLENVKIYDMSSWCKLNFGNIYANPLYYAYNLYLDDALVENLVLPEGLSSIDMAVFSRCQSIKSVTIPVSVYNIESYAFHHCDNLREVYYEGTEREWRFVLIDENSYYLTEADIHYLGSNK